MAKIGLLLFLLVGFLFRINAQEISSTRYIFAERDSIKLKAYVFTPDKFAQSAPHPAIVIFHGGGWNSGEPSWAFGRAKYFAERGFVAIAAQYRLSDRKQITPRDAVDDAMDIIRWTRQNHKRLNIDPQKLVGYGWSAGAHLVACAAIFGNPELEINSIPNALVLISPAVSTVHDQWFKKLLLDKIPVQALSPDELVRPHLPPTLILQGRTDTVTPLAGVKRFTNRMQEQGIRCELIVFDGVGHLFTPSSQPDDGFPNPDKNVQQQAYQKIDSFLKHLGYMK